MWLQKHLVRRGYCRLLEVGGRFKLRRYLERPGDALAILMYHGIEDCPQARRFLPQDVAASSCMHEIRFFQRQGYRVVAPGDWSEHKSAAPKLTITFDDGNRNTFALLRRLAEREGIPVLVAVCPQVVETGEPFWYEEVAARLALSQSWAEQGPRDEGGSTLTADRYLLERYFMPRQSSKEVLAEVQALTPDVNVDQVLTSDRVHANMGWGELAILAATGRCTIAAHGMAHEAATHVAPDEFERDAARCRALIEEKLGVECLDYVYPFGSDRVYSDHTEAALRRVGYRRSYTTVHRMNRVEQQMALGRFTGTGLDVSPRYYEYLWRERHATATGTSAATL